MPTVIYDNQKRDYMNPQSTDLDSVLYSKGIIDSPNVHLGKFILLECARYKHGHYKTIEEAIAYIKDPFTLITATEYCKEI